MTGVPDLAAIVGSSHVAYTDNGRIVSPASTEEVSELLRACSIDGLTVVPAGGGTKLSWGYPVQADIQLSMHRLAGVYEHAWADLTATAGAGTSWADLQRVLAGNRQRVALDPLFPSRATVGGVLATNDSGSLRARYGSLRDLVLGMTLVLADGTIAHAGGKVVKNVAGYDLPKLLTGSFGTLGVITDATFRLHPLPSECKSLTLRGPDALALGELMKRLYAAHLSIERCQLRNEATSFALDVQLASVPETLQEQQNMLRDLAANEELLEADDGVWQKRESLFADVDATVLKATSLPARLPALVAGFAQLAQMPEVSACCVAEPSGIAFAALRIAGRTDANDHSSGSRLKGLLEDLRNRLRPHGGSVVVLQRGAIAESFDLWGGLPSAIEVMRSVKAEFDPQRILNPGRFVGGI